MEILSVINYKGGVGKTTLTANLGAELAFRGKNVLLLDLDAQASLTFSFVKPDYWQRELSDGKTIKSWFESYLSNGKPLSLENLIITPHEVNRRLDGGRLDLIPSHLGLINVDLELATDLGGGTLKQTKRKYVKVHRRLADGLGQLLPDAYDVVLIDCPPNFNIVTKTAIVASDSVLIPAKPDYLSTLGISYLQRSLADLVKDYNDYADHASPPKVRPIDPSILGVVFTMVSFYAGKPISTQRPYIAETKKLGVPVFDSYIRENKTLFGDAAQYGLPVVMRQEPPGTYGRIVNELETLATEFLRKLGSLQHA